ncbi:MAG: cytochrome c4 [gamma proteobacterium symbiont of Bathyaustriella thionipta]|nr:cytochrome c4 [gamma proteobacterium symbiont of Bathyaustriella thionipta]
MKKWIISLSIVLAASSGTLLAAADIGAGKAKSAMCAACHMPDGNSVNPIWPKLAQQHASYLAKQLHDFKSGARKDPTMAGMAAALTDADIANLTAYYSTQKSAAGSSAADQVELGKKIWRAGLPDTGVAACAGCHGPAGSGNALAKFPRIAGQHAAYTEKQLKAFRTHTRNNDINSMMQGVVERMTDEEIKAVAEYAQGLYQ